MSARFRAKIILLLPSLAPDIGYRGEPLDVAPNPAGDVARVKNPSTVSRGLLPGEHRRE